MGTLDEDLAKNTNEFYTKKDLNAGLEFVKEVAGAMAVGGFALTVLTSWMPAIGITLGTATIVRIMTNMARVYSQKTPKERKQIRAAIKYIKGGFDLGDFLIG